MSLANVLRLEDYRGKRSQRLRLSDRLYSRDRNRVAVFRYLTEISDLCEADRVATVWVDEYGPGAVHPHVVLDHLMDRPRRYFSTEPLRKAWELGVPGAIDALSEPGSSVPATFAISLGSDGMRAWFVVAESSAGRPLLQPSVRDRLMFLAGECASVLLHRELDHVLPPAGEGSDEEEPCGFAGWSILKDLEGRESDEETGRTIAQRFVVARVARVLLDEDLVIAPERMQEQVRRARAELPESWDPHDPADREIATWHRVLDAMETGALDDLAEGMVAWGDLVEKQGHFHGALELYGCAYDVAVAVRATRAAAEAARFRGGLLRRRADRIEAEADLKVAHDVAELAGHRDVLARSLVGLALLRQDTGNLPAARSELGEALIVAEASEDRDSVGMVYHALMGLEKLSGNLTASLQNGWVSVARYECPERRARALAGLAGALLECGDREAAEDAWALVASTSRDRYYLTYAHDALAHLAALRGDRASFERHAALCDGFEWQLGSGFATAEILMYRGLSYRALGDTDDAKQWLSRALQFAGEHGFNQVLFKAEEALEQLAAEAVVPTDPSAYGTTSTSAAPPELRHGLRTMRRELTLTEA